MKKLTQVTRLKARMDAAMYEVMGLLEWDMMLYTMFKYECGLAYLNAYLQGDMDAIDQMQRSASYWGWWKLQWYLREQEYLDKYQQWHLDSMRAGMPILSPMQNRYARELIYRRLNNGAELAKGITPDGKRLEDTYCTDLAPNLITDSDKRIDKWMN